MSTNDLTRRRFLGTAAAAAAGAAVTLPAQAASVANPAPAKWDIETDVVVLGCGGAGLMAACQAFDRGAKVEIFDKGMSPFHTATNLCGGLFTAYGSRMQKADPKIKDSWKAFADDIIAYGEHMSLKEPVYAFAMGSRNTTSNPTQATRTCALTVRIPLRAATTLKCSPRKLRPVSS